MLMHSLNLAEQLAAQLRCDASCCSFHSCILLLAFLSRGASFLISCTDCARGGPTSKTWTAWWTCSGRSPTAGFTAACIVMHYLMERWNDTFLKQMVTTNSQQCLRSFGRFLRSFIVVNICANIIEIVGTFHVKDWMKIMKLQRHFAANSDSSYEIWRTCADFGKQRCKSLETWKNFGTNDIHIL